MLATFKLRTSYVCSFEIQTQKFLHIVEDCFYILHIKFWLSLFFYATSIFIFLQHEAGSARNTMELSNKVLLSKQR